MAEEDHPQLVGGIMQDADDKSTDEFHQAVLPALDVDDKHRFSRVRNEGDAAGLGTSCLPGRDDSGNNHYLRTTTNGEVIMNIGAEYETEIHDNETATAGGAAVEVVAETTTQAEKFIGVQAAGVGLVKCEVLAGVVDSETLRYVFYLTASKPNEFMKFPAPIDVASGEKIKVMATNLELGGSPGKDVVVYGTLVKEE